MADGTPYDAEWLATCDINVMLENKGVGELDAFTASEAQLLQPRGKSTVMLLDTEVDEIDLEGAWFAHFGSVYFVDRPEDYNDIYSPEDWEKMMLKVRVAAGHSLMQFLHLWHYPLRLTRKLVFTIGEAAWSTSGSWGKG